MMKKKKAIFGGSFDPPHIGHLKIIHEAINSLDISELIIVPAFLNPFKSENVAPAHLRLKWLRAMTKKMKNVSVSSFEIDKNRAVASIETVEHFKKGCDSIYLIIGADNLKNLHKWYRFEDLDKIVSWVVATRDKIEIPKGYTVLNVNRDISATRLRENMEKNYIDKNIADEIITYYKEKNG